MAVFTWVPEFGAEKRLKPNVTSIKFGDGYEQRVAFGLNTKPQSWSLTFANRSESEATAIDSFLFARGAVESFDWTPPGEASALRFKCTEWSKVPLKANLFTISAVFDQVFE